MTNADLFKKIFGMYAEELWSLPTDKMTAWLVADAPTAEPERKKGKWVNDGKGFYKCTSCGEAWSHWWAVMVPPDRMYKELRFCPHCGAEMEEGGADDTD